jgi:REP element-mobilizing transposase RayT
MRRAGEARTTPASSASAPAAAAQLALFKKRGGKRRGAGRPAKGPRAGSPHKTRDVHHARFPVHVVLRVVRAIRNLRRREVYRAVRRATVTTARRMNFRIVHLSIQHNHLHLIVEADDKAALASGMQGFQISAAKHLNAAISKGRGAARRRGAVFVDRYHAVPITCPRQARHALSYVINNWRKHGEDRHASTRGWTVDLYSSGPTFSGWREYGEHVASIPRPLDYEPLLVAPPHTWLLCAGWKKAGSISSHDVPSERRPV